MTKPVSSGPAYFVLSSKDRPAILQLVMALIAAECEYDTSRHVCFVIGCLGADRAHSTQSCSPTALRQVTSYTWLEHDT